MRLLARNAGCLSRPEVDRWTRKAISVLGTGEKGLVKAVLKVCARQPYGPGNPDADTWGRVLASLAKEQEATATRCESGWYVCHRNALILRGILAALDRKH